MVGVWPLHLFGGSLCYGKILNGPLDHNIEKGNCGMDQHVTRRKQTLGSLRYSNIFTPKVKNRKSFVS